MRTNVWARIVVIWALVLAGCGSNGGTGAGVVGGGDVAGGDGGAIDVAFGVDSGGDSGGGDGESGDGESGDGGDSGGDSGGGDSGVSDSVGDSASDSVDEDVADAASVDVADTNDGADTADAADATDTWVQPPVWDVALIEDKADAQCVFGNKHTAFKDGVTLDVWNLDYVSYESIGGVLQPIAIKAFAARPAGGGVLPGVVQAHGLGGNAKETHATGLAALTGTFVIAYTGPGGGDAADNTSGGLPSGHDNGKRMFDVFPDIRGTWFWGHAMAARRAVTCLTTRPDVDPTRLGITGFSAGGVTSFLVGGSDARIKAAVPLSGVLAWDIATQSANAWQHTLLLKAGLSTASPEWQKLMSEFIAPGVALAGSNGKLYLVNGSSDEFFPLTAGASTWTSWKGQRWQSVVGNFDHGVYQAYGAALPGGVAKITADADMRARGAQRALFHHVFGTDGNYGLLPEPPEASFQSLGPLTAIIVVPKPSPPKLTLESVELWWTHDKAKTWLHIGLEKANGVWSKQLPSGPPPGSVWYVDAVYKTSGLFPERFSVSTSPAIPGGFVPDIWGMP